MPTKLAGKFTAKSTLGSPARVYKGLKTSNWGKREWLRLVAFLVVCGGLGYLTFSTFAASTIAHPDGSLIEFSSSPAVYMIEGGQKRPITSEDAFNSNHFSWGMIVPGNAADLNLPNGPNIGLRAGTLIMTPGNPTVWVVVDNGTGNYTKWGIPNQAIFNSLGYNYSLVMTVPPGELPADSPNLITGSNHPGGQFVQDSNGIDYMIGATGKFRVATPTVLATYNFPVYVAVPGDDALPVQGFLPYHEGTLVKGSYTTFIIGCPNTAGAQATCDWQKHGFTDMNTYTSLGFPPPIFGNDSDLNIIPTGAAVSLPPPCLPSNPSCNPPAPAPPPPPAPKPTPPPGSTKPPPPPTGLDPWQKPSGFIDSPSAGSTVFGNVVIRGWALDNTSYVETRINSISVSIDNHPAVGNLTRTNRADVCTPNNYPNRVDCPNVGYEFNWNSSTVGNGTHEIELTITDSDPVKSNNPAGPHSTTIYRLVKTANALPPSGEITVPQTGSHVTGTIIIRGWAMDNTVKPEHAVSSVKISVNSQLVGNATYGQQNPTTDTVCSNYPNRPGCPSIGWSFALDTTQYPNGSTLNVKATITDADSPPSTATIGATYVVGNGQVQTCPSGQTGTPPNCKTPPPTSGSGGTQTIQVVYAYPSGMSPDQVELNDIPLGISQFQTFLKNSTAGVISSKPKGIAVNLSSSIQRVPLPKTTAQYEQAAGISSNHSVNIGYPLDNIITADLAAKLSTAGGKKYLVYIDGAYDDANCGWGGGSFAKFYLKAIQFGDPARHAPRVPCEDRGNQVYVGGPIRTSFFSDLAPLHEIFHTMGLVETCSPHYDHIPANAGHATEANDLMHWIQTSANEFVDVNNDDYYGPNLPASCPGLTSPQNMAYFNTL